MLLKQITLLRGVSGNEGAVRDALKADKALKGKNIKVDTMGNLHVMMDGGNKKLPHILMTAHMDEVGIMVTSATEEGLLRIVPVGGVDPRVVVSKRVLMGQDAVPGVIGAKAIHLQSVADRDRVLGFGGLYVDIGATGKAQAEQLCPPGSYGTFDSEYVEFGAGFVKAKALDDRVGCLSLLEVIDKAKYPGKLTCVFTVQEEVGLRGAQVAAWRTDADLALVLEGTTCNDLGDIEGPLQVTRAGGGAVLSFMDRSAIANPKLLQAVQAIADAANIPWQYKQAAVGGTDAGIIHKTRGGVACVVIAVPCRYIHSPASVCKKTDIAAQQKLALACIEAFSKKNPLQ